jgi:hypothetical protein
LECNPNRTFYEKLGAQLINTHPHDWNGINLTMCVYKWHDIRSIVRDVDVRNVDDQS